MKKSMIFLLVFIMFISFSGCKKDNGKESDKTSKTQSAEADKTTDEEDNEEDDTEKANTTKKKNTKLTVEDIISDSIANAGDIESYDLNLDINSPMTFMGFPVTFTSVTTGTAFINPMKMMTETQSVVKNVSKTNSISYMEKSGDSMYVYSKLNNDDWKKQEIGSKSNQFNVLDMVSLCLESIENLDLGEEDEVDGEGTYVIEGSISGESMEKIVKQSGLLNNLSSLGGGADVDLEGIYDDLGDMNLKLWIQKDTFYPVQYEMDMTEIVIKIFDRMKEAGTSPSGAMLNNLKVKSFNIVTKLSNFNNAEDFDIPKDAKNA